MLITKIRYWLARHICRRYAREYIGDVDRMGLAWTLSLIDEDVELYGHPFNHTLARAGVIDYAEAGGMISWPVTPGRARFSSDPPGVRRHGAQYGPGRFVSTSRIV